MYIIAPIVIFLISIALYILIFRNRAEVSDDIFLGRNRSDVVAAYTRFARYNGFAINDVEELLEFIENTVGLPNKTVMPDDRFDVELKPKKGWEFDSAHNSLFNELLKLSKEQGVEINLAKVKTVGDYIIKMLKVYK